MTHSKYLTLLCCTLISGCAGGGAGPLGIGAIIGDRNLGAAEPLFSDHEEKCLVRADELLSAFFEETTTSSSQSSDGRNADCVELSRKMRTVLRAPSEATTPSSDVTRLTYTDRQRNETIDAMIASSNLKCNRYLELLKNADGAWNSGIGIASIVTGGLGAFVAGEDTAKALSGTAAILSGSRAAVNEVYLNNLTIHVVAAAIEKVRIRERQKITNRQECDVRQYTLMRGVEDAFNYHRTCSIIAGLAETALAVQRSDNPGVAEMRKALTEYANFARQVDEIGAQGTITEVSTASPVPSFDDAIATRTELASAAARAAAAHKAFADASEKLDPGTKIKLEKNLQSAKISGDKAQIHEAQTKLTNYMKDVNEAKAEFDRAAEKRNALQRQLSGQLQQLASFAVGHANNVEPETRACPFNVARSM